MIFAYFKYLTLNDIDADWIDEWTTEDARNGINSLALQRPVG